MKLPRLTSVQWLICIIAAIGFAFDTYELLMLPLIIKPALASLGGLKPGTPEFANWASWLFWAPALVGGFFGLIGGYLTDRLGRRRVLTWSILVYAFSACAAGFATSLKLLLFFRCLVFLGVCVEFVAAVAWLAELFPEPKVRERVLGYTQAFGSVGGLLVSLIFKFAVAKAEHLPAIHGAHDAWRYTLISGVIPALPLIFIRPFLPESPEWQQKKEKGLLTRPSFGELFQPQLRKTTLVTALMFACSFGAAFGAIQQLPQIVPGLVKTVGMAAPDAAKLQQSTVATVQLWQEVGGLVGRLVLAFLAVRIVSRRALLRVFQVPGLLLLPFVFYHSADLSMTVFKWGVFFCGLLTVAQFSFWGNYLPRVYPLHLRGTGESFAANIGGRMLGTSAAFVTLQLAPHMNGTPGGKISTAAAIIGFTVYAVGFGLSFMLPEPPAEGLAD